MIGLIFILVSLVLFFGFLLLTRAESRRGLRYFAQQRAQLDSEAERWSALAVDIDYPAFFRDGSRALLARIVHDAAHLSLIAVRSIERLLTRAVRALRIRRENANGNGASPASTSEFVSVMKDFKEELRNGRKIEEEAVSDNPTSQG